MRSGQIQAVHRNGNLHVKIVGNFDTTTALGAVRAINNGYQKRGNVFANNKQMEDVLDAGARTFMTEYVRRCSALRQPLHGG